MSPITSRRTLAKGAAWAAPVVFASSTIPAFAASRPEYDLAASWGSTNTYTYKDCPSGQAYYDTITFDTATSVAGKPAGFAIRAYGGTTETTTATLAGFTLKVAFPAGIISALTVTSGAYTVSGPVTQDVLGVQSDVFTFIYNGTTSSTTIPEGATTPSWPNSILRTNVSFNPNVCYPIMDDFAAQFVESFTTANGYSENYTSPWIVTATS